MRVKLGADFDLEDYQRWLMANGAEILSPLGSGRSSDGLSYRTRVNTKKKTLQRPNPISAIVAGGRCWRDIEAFLGGHDLPNRILPIEAFELPEGEHQLCADASVHRFKNCQRSAWGACLLRPGMHPIVIGGGYARHNFRSSNHAEIAAVGNAIAKLVAMDHIKPGDRIRVFNDNKAIIGLLTRSVASFSARQRSGFAYDARMMIEDLLHKHRLQAQFEWVKGHQRLDVECYRARANRLADERAREECHQQKSTKKKDAVHG